MARVNTTHNKPSDPPGLVRAELSVRGAAWLAGQPSDFLADTVSAQGLCQRAEPECRGGWWPGEGGPNHGDITCERELAERLCGGCPARLACLALSYGQTEHGRWGIWGGVAARDRHELRKLWKQARADAASPSEITAAETSGRVA